MPNYALSFDSSTEKQSFTVFDLDTQVQILNHQQESKSSMLLSELIAAFEEQHINAKDISLLLTSVGPGSFTGIRTAITIIKTIAAELDIKIFATDNFELYRFANKLQNTQAIALPAGKNDYFVSKATASGEENFFTLELPETVNFDEELASKFKQQDKSKLIYELYQYKTQNNIKHDLISYQQLEAYYLREPSLGKKKQHATSR